MLGKEKNLCKQQKTCEPFMKIVLQLRILFVKIFAWFRSEHFDLESRTHFETLIKNDHGMGDCRDAMRI